MINIFNVYLLRVEKKWEKLSLWKDNKSHEFNFIDRIIGEHLYTGGTKILIHKLIGINDIVDTGDNTQPSTSESTNNEVFIQDLLFLENRDRKYDTNIYDLRGQYSIPDQDGFDFSQFGLFLSNDTLFVNFHIESMVDVLGRKLKPGDVIELPHLRDDLVLGDDAINRFHVVTDGSRPSEGYDPSWWPHLWRVKCGPITDSQEFRDILGDGTEENNLRDLISSYEDVIDINDKIIDAAENAVGFDPQYRDNAHLYFDESSPDRPSIGFEYGPAPIRSSLLGSGITFPIDASDGSYFMRTDFRPSRVFKKSGNRWILIKSDMTGEWAAANKILTTFINNNNVRINTDGTTEPEQTNLAKVVLPRTDV